MFQIAELSFPYPIEMNYSYLIPENLKDVQIGQRAVVKLRNREEMGIIIDIQTTDYLHPQIQYKEIIRILEPFPVVNQEQIYLSRWMSEYYVCEMGEALDKMYPVPTKISKKELENLSADLENASFNFENLVELHPDQKEIYEQIKRTLFMNRSSVHLIQGITGSGKTEIYLHLIADILQQNKTVIFLVPEISLTVQMIERIRKIVGNSISILHSGLTAKERYWEYLKIFYKKTKVVLGTRSAIFAPLQDLGLIIIDEEHDSSFRENSHPRYDARMIARKRSENNKFPVIFGSATPRIEIRFLTEKYHNKENSGIFFYFYYLKKRAMGSLPKVEIIERDNFDQPISNQLLKEIEKNFIQKKQTLLLLNRRGYYPYLYCRNCKENVQCFNCSVSLCLHKEEKNVLKCHYCNHTEETDFLCKKCGNRLIKLGTGIQKLEEYLLSLYPDLKIERLDTDIVQKGKVLREVINDFLSEKIDILIGTQMISKGIDAPNLSLVGVLQADTGFYLPDFRSYERTFSMLVQVAGRAGRRYDPGRVYFEVIDKNNPYLIWAMHQNYESFFKFEIQNRKQFLYPPFVRLIRFLIRTPDQLKGNMLIHKLNESMKSILFRKLGLFYIIGPSLAPIEKLHNKYRFHILLKTNYFFETLNEVRTIIKTLKKNLSTEEYLEIEIDPVDLL